MGQDFLDIHYTITHDKGVTEEEKKCLKPFAFLPFTQKNLNPIPANL